LEAILSQSSKSITSSSNAPIANTLDNFNNAIDLGLQHVSGPNPIRVEGVTAGHQLPDSVKADDSRLTTLWVS